MNFKTENSTTPNGDWSQSKAFTNSGSSFPVLNGTCELDQENLALSNSGQHESIFTQDSGLHGIDVAAPSDITDLNNQSGYQYNNNLAHDLYFTGSMEMPTTQHPYITNTNNHLSYSNSSEEFSPIGNNMSPDSTGGANSNNFTSGNKRKASNESFSPLSGHHYGTESGNNNNNNGTSRSSQSSSHKSRKKLLDEKDAALIARDDSELTEEELQMKRKAQNRAAQRAFRERKESKLKELEAKLLASEEERQKLLDELEQIKKQNISIATENEILKHNGMGNINNDVQIGNLSSYGRLQVDKFNFPKTQKDFIEHVLQGTNHQLKDENKDKVYNDNQGHKLLALGAVWDYLQIKAEEADLDFNSIDFNDVMEKLKGNEKCHGYGPAYPLELVNEAIESSLN
ncbi:fluconazole resistance protein 3 [Candida albicans P87]|nr:fluconazole resistance protein 3 [Candida albicans P87]